LEKPYDEKAELEFKDYLETIGDSLVVVSDDDLIKVHVHTNDPGLAIQRALTYGSLSRMKIDNMREEHQEKLIKESEKLAEQQKAEREKKAEPRKTYGFISVSAGEGLDEIFRGIGADFLIEGGQTMNPSTEDMLNAIDRVNADTVYIFPNNKNIILAAEQAKGLVEDKKVIVIPSKTIPQGITAIINFAAELTPEDNERNMIEEMSRVKTGQITYAVRNTVIDDIEIQEGDIMALGDQGILAVGKDIESTVLHSLVSMVEEESELVTIYYGKDVDEEEANVLREKAEEKFSACEVELHAGGQPIYYYLISVE
jgi:DAK2 domain fusion protein YloV